MSPGRRFRRPTICSCGFLFVHIVLVLPMLLPSIQAWSSRSDIASSPPPAPVTQHHRSPRLNGNNSGHERGTIRMKSLVDNGDTHGPHGSSNVEKEFQQVAADVSLSSLSAIRSRRSCFVATAAWGCGCVVSTTATVFSPFTTTTKAALAFEGGIGGLGKTKPETGVQFWNPGVLYNNNDNNNKPMTMMMMQNAAGVVAAELNVNNQPVLVSFAAPWPLLPTTAGLEARDLQLPESAFVQVITAAAASSSGGGNNNVVDLPTTKTQARDVLLHSVLGPQGKFGAYGTPVDVKIKTVPDLPAVDNNKNQLQKQNVVVYRVSFTAYTPGLRETDRQALVAFHKVGKDALVLLVVGTTQVRFPQKEAQLLKIISSFEVVPAPLSSTTRRS